MIAAPRELPKRLDEALAMLEPYRPAVVYLFGTFGTARQRPESDIDLAFLPEKPGDVFGCFETANRLSVLLGREVDLVDLSRASTVMRKEVFRTGTVVACADQDQRAEFEMYTLSDYARLNEERREVLDRWNSDSR